MGGNGIVSGGCPPIVKAGIGMRNVAVICGMCAVMGMAAELPICEEFNGEAHVSCVATDSAAVITTMSEYGKTVEFFKNGKKAYFEVGADGSVIASSGVRSLELDVIPSDDEGAYLQELLDAVLDDIAWND